MTLHTDADLGAYALRLERRSSHPLAQPRSGRTRRTGRAGRRRGRARAAQDFIDTP